MIRIDDSLLEELGLMALPKEERNALLRQIYETLEMRVGMKLAERMSDQQLDEFESFLPDEKTNNPGDEAGALKWLETNFPDYKQVVASELEVLKSEIKKDSAKIVEAYQAQGGALPQQQPQQQAPQPQQMPQNAPTQNNFGGQPVQQPPVQSQAPDQNQQPPTAA